MSLIDIFKLTPEEENLLAGCRDKWKAIILSTKPINREKATEAVSAAYVYITKKKPKIIFFDNPYLAWKAIFTELKEQLGIPLGESILDELHCDLYLLSKFGRHNVWGEGDLVDLQIIGQIERELNTRFNHYDHDINPYGVQVIRPESWVNDAGWFDFEIIVKKDPLWQRERVISLLLFESCGWIFPFENICIICDRPSKLSLDNQQRLHAEGEAAIQFADGYTFLRLSWRNVYLRDMENCIRTSGKHNGF